MESSAECCAMSAATLRLCSFGAAALAFFSAASAFASASATPACACSQTSLIGQPKQYVNSISGAVAELEPACTCGCQEPTARCTLYAAEMLVGL